MSERFGLYTGEFVHAGGTLNLTQIEEFNANPNTTMSPVTPAGLIDPAHVGMASAQPTMTLSTRDIGTLFGTLDITTGLASSGNFDVFWQERADNSTFLAAATATHMRWTATGGFLRPTTISASQDSSDGATLNMEYTALWDGTNDPIALTDAVAINLEPTPAFGARYWLGPVYHAGAALGGITQVDIDCGIEYSARAVNGDPWARKGSIVARNPRITFTCIKSDIAAGLNSLFNSAISTGVVVYLQKGAASAGSSTTGRVAVGTAEHIKITAAAGDIQVSESSVSGTEDSTVEISVIPTGALAISVASAIP